MTDIILLALGGFLGLGLALFAQPLLEDRANSLLVRLLGSTNRRSRKSIAGTWDHCWSLDAQASSFNAAHPPCAVKQLRMRVTASWLNEQEQRTYVLVGEIEQERYVVGRWYDQEAGPTYSGSFLLAIHLGGNSMTGKLLGYDDKGQIRCGLWEWKRTENPIYGSEDAA